MTEQLAEVHVYRPGAALAVALMCAPPFLALVAAGGALLSAQRVPVLVPLLLALYIGVVPLTWFLLISVRSTPSGIASARPWLPWKEVPWEAIERAEQRWMFINLTGADGRSVAFAPSLLQNGTRLRREIFVRLAPQVLDKALRAEARTLLADQLVPKPGGGLEGTVRTQPRRGTGFAAGLIALLAIACGVVAGTLLRDVALIIAVSLCVVVLVGSLSGVFWLAQRIEMSDAGLRVTYAWPRRARTIAWTQVLLLEHTRAERIIRLRGDTRVTCAGPALLRSSERAAMRAFLNAYCVERGVPVVERVWLL